MRNLIGKWKFENEEMSKLANWGQKFSWNDAIIIMKSAKFVILQIHQSQHV